MKAIQLKEYGGPEKLIEVDIPKPVPKTGQVLVRVHATSLNPIDIKRTSGKMREILPIAFPFIPGGDFSGEIDAVGEGVSGFNVGNEVYGSVSEGGSYAEFMAVDAGNLTMKPRNITHIEAASLALVAQTALQALNHARLEAGQTILIMGAGGAVGSAAVQLAHSRGAKVIASGSVESLPRLRAYGAVEVFDYKTTPFESVAKDVDVVLDGVGGEVQQRAFAVLKPRGVLVAITQPPSQEEAAKHRVRALMFSTESSIATLREITAEIEAGKLKPHVAMTYPLSQAAKGWEDYSNHKVEGKIVFVVIP
jgi:NADPH:quinone reductase-like Zn-dependent oxidoreductase